MNTTIFESQSRRNEAFIRQGGWFFLPAPRLVVDPKRIRRDAPIHHSGDKAHMVEQLFRSGGEAVYYSETRRLLLTVPQFRKLLQQRPQAVKEDWRIMQSRITVYGRGTVQHPDHRTITLHDWHRILINTESETPAMENVARLD